MAQMVRFEKAAPGILDLIARVGMYIAVLILMTFILVAVAAVL